MTTTSSSEKPSFTEKVEQLTGFDELAIEKAFGKDIDGLRLTMQLRAVVFIDETRSGANTGDAKKAAMGLTIKNLRDYFGDEPEELDEETPVNPAGEGDSPSE